MLSGAVPSRVRRGDVCAFAEQLREAREHGGWRAETSVWIHTIFDFFLTAPQEHFHVIRQDLALCNPHPGCRSRALRRWLVLSLALGIGANTAIFSLLNSVLMSALPVRDPQALVMSDQSCRERCFSGIAAQRAVAADLSRVPATAGSVHRILRLDGLPEPARTHDVRVDGGEPEEIGARMVSAEYFSTLGVPALLGRTFSAADDPAAPYAVISYDYWQRRFGRRADILGTTIAIRQGVFSIIGVRRLPSSAKPSGSGPTSGCR